jgi:TatD DNase family protein
MLIEVGTTVEDSLRAVEVFKDFKKVLLSVGVHPHESDGLDDRGLETLKSLLKDRKVVAVGEIGLDFSEISPPEKYKSAFSLSNLRLLHLFRFL